MKQTQENRKAMFESTVAFLDNNQSVWSTQKAFTTAVADLKAKLATIDELSSRQHESSTGATADKDQARDFLEEGVIMMADQLAAMAAANNAPGIAAEVDLNRSDLDKLSAEDLDKTAKRIHELATQYLPDLADYNVTQDDVNQLDGRRTNFGTAKTAPRSAIADRKAATATLPQAMNEADRILRDRIDKLVTPFLRKDPNFVAGYRAVRVIVDHAGPGVGVAPNAAKPAPAPTNN